MQPVRKVQLASIAVFLNGLLALGFAAPAQAEACNEYYEGCTYSCLDMPCPPKSGCTLTSRTCLGVSIACSYPGIDYYCFYENA